MIMEGPVHISIELGMLGVQIGIFHHGRKLAIGQVEIQSVVGVTGNIMIDQLGITHHCVGRQVSGGNVVLPVKFVILRDFSLYPQPADVVPEKVRSSAIHVRPVPVRVW